MIRFAWATIEPETLTAAPARATDLFASEERLGFFCPNLFPRPVALPARTFAASDSFVKKGRLATAIAARWVGVRCRRTRLAERTYAAGLSSWPLLCHSLNLALISNSSQARKRLRPSRIKSL